MGKKKKRPAATGQATGASQSTSGRQIPGWVKVVGAGGVVAGVLGGVILTMLTPWFAASLEVMSDTDPVVAVGGMHVSSDGQSRQLWKATICVANRGLFSGSLKSTKVMPAGLERVPNVEMIGLDRDSIRFLSVRPVQASFILNDEPIGQPFKFNLEFFDEKDKYIGAVVLQGTNRPPTSKPSVDDAGNVTVTASVQVSVIPEGMCDSK